MNLKRKGRRYRSSCVSSLWHVVKAVSGRAIFGRSIKRNKGARILVVLHLYYMDAWPSIKRYLENLAPYHFDLVVTYISGHFDPAVLEAVRKFKKDVRLYEYENKGYDIGGFIDVLSLTNIDDYDLVYKLQSKGVGRDFIYIYDQVFKYADWFLNLFDGILGEFSVHRTVNYLMRRPKTGLVASHNLIIQDPPHKRAFTCDYAAQICIPIENKYHFVAGSCFAMKASLLSCIQSLHFTIDSFQDTQRGVFSLAHAMERIVCACIEPQGFKMVGIRVPHPRYCLERRYRRSVSALRLLEDNRFSIDYDYFYKSLELFPVYSYEIKQIRLGDLRRYWDGRFYLLRECSPYAYVFGDSDRYSKYTEINREASPFIMSRDRFDKLIKSLEENGFDQKQLPIVCAQDNTIWDGLHRCCWLLAKYGEDYLIPVLYLDSPIWYHSSNNTPRLNRWEKLRRALFS